MAFLKQEVNQKSFQASIVLCFYGLSLKTRAVRTFINFYVQRSVNREKKSTIYSCLCYEGILDWLKLDVLEIAVEATDL